MLPSVSEWMTSTNCASLGSNLSSGGFPLYKGPAGSRPAKKTELAWQPHAMSHLQQQAFDPSLGGWFTGCRAPSVVRHSHSHPFHSPMAFSHSGGGYPRSTPLRMQPDSLRRCTFFFLPHHMACGILVPQPGIKPQSLAVRAWSLNHWPAEEYPGGVPVWAPTVGSAQTNGDQ